MTEGTNSGFIDLSKQFPSDWNRTPFWVTYRRVKRLATGNEELLSVYRDYGVIRKSDRDDNFNKASDDLTTYQIVNPGDLVINKMKAWQGSVAVSQLRGIVSPAYFVFENRVSNVPRFMHYLLRSDPFIEAYRAGSKGIRPNQWDLDPDLLKIFPLCLPDPSTQHLIVDFLDREAAEIDAFIADQKELIGLLAERRAATISHAVTKGLDPTVPMTETHLDWPASVPAAWSKCAIRNAFTVLDCKHITAEIHDDGDFPLASIREVKGDVVDLTRAKRTTLRFFNALTEGGRAPKPDDLIISRNASVGEVALVPSGLEAFAMGQDVSLIRDQSGSGRTRFLAHVLRSQLGRDAFAAASIGSTFKRINVDDIKSMTFWMPDTSHEIDKICMYLEKETAELDSAIADAREAIVLSSERRAALISAAVTGKIDVREHADSEAA